MIQSVRCDLSSLTLVLCWDWKFYCTGPIELQEILVHFETLDNEKEV